MFDKFIIDPNNSGKKIFDVVIIIFSLWSTITSAYYACFGYPEQEGPNPGDDPIESRTFLIVDSIVEVTFFADIICHFFL